MGIENEVLVELQRVSIIERGVVAVAQYAFL